MWKGLFRYPDLRKRLIFTLVVLIIYKLASYIPTPGIDGAALSRFFADISRTSGGTLFGIMNIISGGAMSRMTIFALGVMPYLSSCIILQILGFFIRPLGRLNDKGWIGRRKIFRNAIYLAIILSVIQSFFISLWLENPAHFMGRPIVQFPGLWFRFSTIFSLTAGVIFIIYLAELITRKGIGNGIALFAVIVIMSRIPVAIYQLWTLRSGGMIAPYVIYLILLLMVSIIIATVIITRAQRKIPIKYTTATDVGDYTSSGAHIPLRFNFVGLVPLGFAQSIILFPATIAAFAPRVQRLAQIIIPGHILYWIVYALLIIFFTYFYTAIVFRPRSIVSYLKRCGGSIQGVKSDEEGADYLDNIMTRVTLIVAIFLVAIAILPSLIRFSFKIPFLVSTIVGGSGLLIVVGVFLEIIEQLKVRISMYQRTDVEAAGWERVCVVFDEMRANIIMGFLQTKNIPCKIESLRFVWRMPIATPIDRFRLNVPSSKVQEVRGLLDRVGE